VLSSNGLSAVIFLTRQTGGKKVTTKDKRWFKDIGLGFKTPSEAINGTYIGMPTLSTSFQLFKVSLDKKCPFTGDISIRGRILTGKVVSTKMNRTIIIRRDYLHYIPKYSAHILLFTFILLTLYADRYEKRHKNLAVHVSPCFRVELGDVVTVGAF
jgi:small subunit ribosomal protein S11e